MQRIRLTDRKYPFIGFYDGYKKTGELPGIAMKANWEAVGVFDEHYIIDFMKECDTSNLQMLSPKYAQVLEDVGIKTFTSETIKYISPESGVIIYGNGVYSFYIISIEGDKIVSKSVWYSGDIYVCSAIACLGIDAKISNDGTKASMIFDLLNGYCIESIVKDCGGFPNAIIKMATSPILFQLFRKYFPREIKVVTPNEKTVAFDCQYKNDLPTDVTLYDSKDLYRIYSDKEVFVRGHWRFQACGEGMKDRKLIFIDPYIKGGFNEGKQDAA